MIKIEIENQGLVHEIYEFLRIIFPSYERENFMCVKIEDKLLKINSDKYNFVIPIKKSTNLQRYLKLELINQLKENQLEIPKWGVLHGIRPLKLIYNLLKDKDEEDVRNYLKNEYSISDEKINLAYEILNIQNNIINENIDNYSVYVHIPFCPSKCTYCSYQTLNSKSSMVDDYVKKIVEEIELESKYLNKNPSSIYIGGGTPTSIGINNLNTIIETIRDSFGDTIEFTVEAGRVETLTDEMIEMLSNHDVDRISINPQSMNFKTVKSINRINSIEEFIECYNKAKPKFKDINMDLIIGLEDETEEDFMNSLESVIKLNPTNITVHSLALKNGTDYLKNQNVSNFNINFNNEVISKLKENNYNPYYLYRQKRIIGGNENIGYSIKGHECIYNIMMIQELHDIWGFGMGATSKLHINSEKFEQIPNFRSMREYLSRNKEVSDKKLKVLFDRYRSEK